MSFAKAVVESLVVSGRMDKDAAESLVLENASIVISGSRLGDNPDDVAHDLFLTIDANDEVCDGDLPTTLPKMRRPVRAMKTAVAHQ